MAGPTLSRELRGLRGLRPGSRDRAVAARLAALAVVAAVGFGVLYAVAVRTRTGQLLDAAAYGGHYVRERGLHHRSWQLLSHITVGSLAFAIVALMGVAFVRRRPRLAFAAGGVVAGSVLAAEALHYVLLTRPALAVTDGAPQVNTFPSGHTTIAMAVAVGFVLVVPDRLRGLAALGGGAYALAVGVATQTAGWHRVSDALGSYLLVVTVTATVLAVLVAWRGVGRAPPTPLWSVGVPAAFLLVVGGLELLLAGPGYLRTVRLVRSGAVPDAAALERAFDAGVDAVNAFALLGMLLVVAVLAGVTLDAPDRRGP